MVHNSNGATPSPRTGQLPTWWTIVFFLVVLGISWWQTRAPNPNPSAPSRSAAPSSDEDVEPAHRPVPVEVTQEPEGAARTSSSKQPDRQPEQGTEQSTEHGDTKAAPLSFQIKNQKIRDQDGKVIYSGTIDLRPALERIARGDANSHRNDGTTFQNRERRLPTKPSGYYKEYVHPTPKTTGPGPQRIIVGKDGDTWYTPDHYRTFQRIQ